MSIDSSLCISMLVEEDLLELEVIDTYSVSSSPSDNSIGAVDVVSGLEKGSVNSFRVLMNVSKNSCIRLGKTES